MAKNAPAEKELYLLIVETEAGERISDDYKYLITKIVSDKIFSKSQDELCIVNDSSTDFCFESPSWSMLKKFKKDCCEPAEKASSIDLVSLMSYACESLSFQSTEDNYVGYKLLYFGQFKTELEEDTVQTILEVLKANESILTLVFPKLDEMNAVQRKNYKLMLKKSETSDLLYVADFESGLAKVVNKICRESKRSAPSKFDLQIGTNITIPVKKLIANQKLHPKFDTGTKQLVVQEFRKLNPVPPLQATSKIPAQTPAHNVQTQTGRIAAPLERSHQSALTAESGRKEVVQDLPIANQSALTAESERKEVVQDLPIAKETSWKTKEGIVLDETKLQEGYMYGGELVPEEEGSCISEPTEQCLQILQFCPRENIPPIFLLGDKMDILYPQDNNSEAQAKFHGLLEALLESNCIGIARYVYRKNAAVNMWALIPDRDRQGLMASDLCYADDVGIPFFAPIVQNNASTETEDALIDELINLSSIAEFNPETGPVNPKLILHRDTITHKILHDAKKPEQILSKKYSTIDIHFDKHEYSDELMQKLKDLFPLMKAKKPSDARPAGHQVFRKRRTSSEIEADDEKKLKMCKSPIQIVAPEVVADEDLDELIGQI